MQTVNKKNIYRVIDANFNRLKEGLRVCEDVRRFMWDDEAATRKFKVIRHKLTDIIAHFPSKELLSSRDIESDVGRGSTVSEFRRQDVSDIFFANIQRSKESLRVLEEFTKLVNAKRAAELKKLRYQIYAVEKSVVKKR